MIAKILRLRLGSEACAKCDGNVYVGDPGQQFKFFFK